MDFASRQTSAGNADIDPEGRPAINRLAAKGRLLDPATDLEEQTAGFALYLKGFPGLAGSHQVRVEPDGSFNPSDLRRAAGSVRVVHVGLN